MPKETYYFSHDYNARHDPKIVAMRVLHGYEGYGWYWAIIEILREDGNFRFPLSDLQISGLAMQLETNAGKLKQYLQNCIKIGLFYEIKDNNESFLMCMSLNNRMTKYVEIKQHRSIAGKKGAEARWQTHGKGSKSMANDGKVNEIKLNKIKEKKEKKALPSGSLKAVSKESEDIAQLWNKFCELKPELSRVKSLSSSRKKSISARMKEPLFQDFKQILIAAKDQSFLFGNNDRGWKMDFDWIIHNDINYLKVLEYKYKNGEAEKERTMA